MLPPFFKSISYFKLNYYNSSDNHYYEKFEDGTINDITEEIPFEIPESWAWTRINSYVQKVTDYVASGSFASLNQNVKYYKEKNYALLVRTVDLSNCFKNEPVFTDEHGYNFLENSNLFGGELILSNVGSIGKVFIVPKLDKKMTLAPNSIMVRCFSQKHINWLYNLFDSSFGLTILLSISSATAIKKFNKTGFKTLLVPIPPLNEQLRIVEELKKYTPIIDKYDKEYSRLENLNNKYKENIKNSILQYAIQGKLVKQDPDDESAEVLISKILDKKRELIKNKQIKKENLSVIYKDSTDNQFYEKFDDGKIVNITDEIPFDIPDGWCWTRMKYICIINPRNTLEDELETSFIPMTLIDGGYSNSHTFEIKKWKEIKTGFTHFKEGDIGIAKITPCFQNKKSTIFKNLKNKYGAGSTELHILRPVINDIKTEYLFWIIKSSYFIDNGVKTYSGTAGQQRINKNFLPNFLVPIPSVIEQQKIVKKIEIIFENL